MKEKSNIFNRDKPLTVMITGGSSGIGFQAVLKLISLGHNIILPCKNISRANEVLTNLFNHSLFCPTYSVGQFKFKPLKLV